MTLPQLVVLLGSLGALFVMAAAVKRALDDPSIPNLAAAVMAVARFA